MDEEKLEIETALLAKDRENVKSFAGDLRQKLSIANLLSATIDEFENVDILINASRQVLESDPLNPKGDNFEALISQNVSSNLRLTQLIAKRMIQQREDGDDKTGDAGTIVNLSSIASDRTHPDLLAYSVSCAALNQLTRSLGVSLAEKSIRVNAIAIGSVESANLQGALTDDPDLRSAIETATPLGRIAKASEVAEVAQFLASKSSGFMTGQIVTVDGGRTLIDPVNTSAH